MKNTIWYLLIIVAVLFLTCMSTPFKEWEYATHKTEHFTIYFRESEFSLPEVQRIGDKKERLLNYVNQTLGLGYDGSVSAYLYLEGDEFAYANTEEEIYESRNYVMTDNGHEVVHIVSFEELGYSQSGFMKEGIAVSLELDFENYNAIKNYVTYRKHVDSVDISDSEWYEKYYPVSVQLATDDFTYSFYSYQRAGAFIKYLMVTYGMDTLLDYYNSTIDNPTSLRSENFEEIFGLSILEAEQQFKVLYFSSR